MNDINFINVLKKVDLGEIGKNVENNLKARFVNESDRNYPRNALHIYAERQPTTLRNQIIVVDLPSKIY